LIAPDASVVVARLSPWHDAHDRSRAALAGEDPVLLAHVGFETVASLSRMPRGYRVAPGVVLDALRSDYPEPWLGLPAERHADCLRCAVAAGLRGGALYDALIAATAAFHDVTLVSADRRARPAYEAMGAHVTYVA
jgi:predicted nucleic acid-binding protein